MLLSACRRLVLAGLLLAAGGLLTACGGADESDPPTAAPTEGRQRALGASSGPAAQGLWQGIGPWPIIAVHMTLLPDGRVLTFGSNAAGFQTGSFEYDVWDPAGGLQGGHTTLLNTTGNDLFCSGQLLLPSTGQVFIAGGDTWFGGPSAGNSGNREITLFTPSNNQMSRGPSMWSKRWYGSAIMLPGGEIYLQGGNSGGNTNPEVRQTDGSFRFLSGADTSSLYFEYPRVFPINGNRVFGLDTNGRMFVVSTSGTGSIASLGQLPASMAGFGTTSQYRPGRLLHISGSSAQVMRIDGFMDGAAPSTQSIAPIDRTRVSSNQTLLADGRVLVTGGSEAFFSVADLAMRPALWDPVTGNWSYGPNAQRGRVYHSTAILLPDARVLVSGSGAQPAPPNEFNAEIYAPSYLYNNDGSLATRPVITAAPTVLNPGTAFSLSVDRSVARLTLLKTGSTSHGFNFDQRFTELPFVREPDGQLTVQVPSRGVDVTPGFYLIFAFDEAGTPSVARTVRMNTVPARDAAQVPVITPPAHQTHSTGTTINLAVVGSDPNGAAGVRWSAAGLPPGLRIDPLTGVISGMLTTPGSYDPVIAISDGSSNAVTTFRWQVSGESIVPLVLQPLSSAGAVMSGSELTVTASATGVNPRYRVDWGDGSAPTAWSSSASASYRYPHAGLFFVTVSATDDRGGIVSRTFMQQVHLPLTAQAARASTNIAYQPLQPAGARLWVVNQDNDSVSVFDALGRTRLAEVPVGAAPRALAISEQGEVWVTNKASASISVIDAQTRNLLRTIGLPRGSQPFGIVMAPQGQTAFVALEGTGQVLRFDTASAAQTGEISLPAAVRHLAISGDGATLFASRFISAPLPGESTITVTPGTQGGELFVVNAASLSQAGTVTLRHSAVADTENTGRGLPNYLGALAISPDGSQGFVPSKQDNILRGQQRDGLPLNFQNTVRAVSSRVVIASRSEDLSRRIDHDNASVASAAVFDPRGNLLFVALETSREVAVVNAHSGQQLMRIDVGRAPQGLAIAPDGLTLFVNNFMDRSVSAHDLRPLYTGLLDTPLLGTMAAIGAERLTPAVLLGKQFFYDAADIRLSRDKYISCASCHNDGGHDGRVWDFKQFGEGLRNTTSLRGRAGAHGLLHWSGNFDEVQDFEQQIRQLAGGTGLMSDAQFNTGTRSQPLGDRKAGVSADLDALAAYVASLDSFDFSPLRPADGSYSAQAERGRQVFTEQYCINCHIWPTFTGSAAAPAAVIGTIKRSSGERLGGPLTGIDVPTLIDVWSSAPYLHDGSAPTLQEAILAHPPTLMTDADLQALVRYLQELGGPPGAAPAPPRPSDPFVPPPPGEPPALPATGALRLEVERGVLAGTARRETVAGASGGAVVSQLGGPAATVDLFLKTSRAGRATLSLRYANGLGSSTAVDLWVNGVRQRSVATQPIFVLPPSGAWTRYASTPTVSVSLVAGVNRIRLQGSGLIGPTARLDLLTVQPSTQLLR
ncbi:MAG: DUF1929 domain-containing protein [Rubrivivax sp.]|nr:DUF1929 domain-containing protein [Rubrivivax sp.]